MLLSVLLQAAAAGVGVSKLGAAIGAGLAVIGAGVIIMMLGSKHANLIYECITYYIYAYQLRCTKQDVLRTLI